MKNRILRLDISPFKSFRDGASNKLRLRTFFFFWNGIKPHYRDLTSSIQRTSTRLRRKAALTARKSTQATGRSAKISEVRISKCSVISPTYYKAQIAERNQGPRGSQYLKCWKRLRPWTLSIRTEKIRGKRKRS
jgi:hypothetical protein